MGDLFHVAGEHRKDCGRGLLASALVEGVNDDDGLCAGGFERSNYKLLHLETKGPSSGIRLDPQNPFPEVGGLMGELKSEGKEDRFDPLKIASKRNLRRGFPLQS